jgi:hypothetical protein
MQFGYRVMISCVFVFAVAVAGASTAQAQGAGWGDLAISAVRLDYDLSGVGNAPGVAVRARRDLSSHVRLEIGGLFAKPDQQFGQSTLLVPEAQLQYRWGMGRLSPYVGGGIGAAFVKSDVHTNWDPTLSVAVGTGVRLTERLGVTGEFRLRGHQWRFTGTTAELSAGLAWRLPSF